MNKIYAYFNLIRFSNYAGTILLFFPCYLTYLNGYFSSYQIVIMLFLLSFYARSFGCVINDIVDAEIDAKTERGKLRPIPSGALSKTEAIRFAIFLATVGIWILSYFDTKIILTILSISSLILIYPFLKRVTGFVQIFLGFIFNLGAIVTPMIIYGNISNNDILIYIACSYLTICYDTIYGFADIKDDITNKVKSFSILVGKRTKLLTYLQFLSLGLFIFAKNSEFKFINYIAIVLYYIFMIWQLRFFNREDSENAIFHFKSYQFLYIIIMFILV
ncbi:MAG: 4-hydroxybenzoate octaprenyltransferase [Rickettsiales bacterium]